MPHRGQETVTRDGDPFCACGDCFRAADGRVLFHGPRVDGFDLIGPESRTATRVPETADRFRTKGSRGSDPRLLRPNNGPATRPHIGERPRASRIVQARGLDQPSINTIAQQDRQLRLSGPYMETLSACGNSAWQYHIYRNAWVIHMPRCSASDLSLTLASSAAPNRNTNTTSQANSLQFRIIACLPVFGGIIAAG